MATPSTPDHRADLSDLPLAKHHEVLLTRSGIDLGIAAEASIGTAMEAGDLPGKLK